MHSGSDLADEAHHVIHVAVEIERAFAHGDIAPIAPVGHVHVEVRQQGLGRGPQQGGEVAGEGGHDQHLGLAVGPGFGKVHQIGEGSRVGHVLMDRHQVAV